MKRRVISYRLHMGQGVRARFYVNDLPLFRETVTGQVSQNGGLNDKLVPGDNEVRIELLKMTAAPPTEGEPKDEAAARGRELLRQRVGFTIFRDGSDGAEDEPIHSSIYPDWLEQVEPERRRIPYHHILRFDPGVELYELAFLRSPPVQVPCEGTRELRQAVDELHACFVARDKSRLVELMSLQIDELAGALEGTGPSVKTQHEAYDEFFANKIDVVPLDRSQLHFTSRAAGRVVEVTRHDGVPVLAAKVLSMPMFHASNLLFTQHEGRWRLM